MNRLDLVSGPRLDKGKKHHRPALLASLLFHALALASAVALAYFYGSHLPLIRSGSISGAPSVSLEKMVIVSPPPAAKPMAPSAPATLPAPILTIAQKPPTPHESVPTRKPSEQGVPVLAVQPNKPTPPVKLTEAEPRPATHPVVAHTAFGTANVQSKTAASASSYAPGLNVLPHPPYPDEAREQRRIGTVVMNVLFDEKGDVAQATIVETSGVPLLDSATLSYIRQHWHSPAYAGRTVSVPIQYKLENL
jgi:protein TonB